MLKSAADCDLSHGHRELRFYLQLNSRQNPNNLQSTQGPYDADEMLLSQSAAIRPVEMRNKPH